MKFFNLVAILVPFVFSTATVASTSNSRCDKYMFGGMADVRACAENLGWANIKIKWIDDCDSTTTLDLSAGYAADASGTYDRIVGTSLSLTETVYSDTQVVSKGTIYSMYEPNNQSPIEATMDLEKNQLTVTSGFGKNVTYPATFNCTKIK